MKQLLSGIKYTLILRFGRVLCALTGIFDFEEMWPWLEHACAFAVEAVMMRFHSFRQLRDLPVF